MDMEQIQAHAAALPERESVPAPASRWRYSKGRIFLALGVAAVSDAVSFFTEVVPPAQIAIDITTAIVLFVIFGRRWAILPGLVAEAIPGLGIFPIWLAVVLSLVVYDEIRRPAKV